MDSLTWSHFTEDVEGLGALGSNCVDTVGSLPLYKQIMTVSGQTWENQSTEKPDQKTEETCPKYLS